MPSIAAALRRIAALGILSVMTGASLTPVHAETASVKLVLPFSFQGALSNWTLPEADGCYKRNQLDVAIDGGAGSGDALTKVATGAYQIGVADFTTFITFLTKQPDQDLIAIFIAADRAPTSIVALKKSGIAKPGDLAGKKIGDNVGEASRELFPAFATANGIDPASVTWINVAANLRQPSLLHGEYDAAGGPMFTITSGLHAIGVTDDDIVVLPYAQYGVDLFGNAVIVKSSWAAAHAAALKAFMVCAVDGMKGSIANPQTAVDSLTSHNSMLDQKQALAELGFSNQFSVLTPNVKAHGRSAVDPARLDKILDQIASAYGVPKPAADKVWNAAYLPPEKDRLVDKP